MRDTSLLFLLVGLPIAIFGAALYTPETPTSPPTVVLDYGTFIGHKNTTTGITSFRGIPYADPPVGELRWRAPVSPPSKHLGIMDATKFGDICLASLHTSIATGMSEDCLFGNVYIPLVTDTPIPTEGFPVMVWFHGGGFESGNSHGSADLLLDPALTLPIVFVSFEYRLGQFGFLGGTRVRDDGVLNAGILDQRAALRWIQRYIRYFDGDPNRVTIWGQSAGAGSVLLHLIANGGDHGDLFRAAIGDSPPLASLPDAGSPYIENIFREFSSFAGCGDEGEATMSCLRSADSAKLVLSGNLTGESHPTTLYIFQPLFDSDDTLLTERPIEAFINGHFAPVPVIFGSNSGEGERWANRLPPHANTSEPNANEDTVYNFLQGQYPMLSRFSFERAVTQHYNLGDYNNSVKLQGQQMYGEMRFSCTPAFVTGKMSSRGLKAYHYRYDNPRLGSYHRAELEAFLGAHDDDSTAPIPDNDDLGLFRRMREYWIGFVANGSTPTPAQDTESTWNPVTSPGGGPEMLLQPNNIGMEDVSSALADRCAFWHSLSDELDT